MDHQKILEQIMDINKTAYDNAVKTMFTFHEKANEMLQSGLEKSPLPDDAKKGVVEIMDAYKNMLNQIVQINKEGYDTIAKEVAASQEKAEEMFRNAIEGASLPDEAKKTMFRMMDAYKDGYAQIKKIIEENAAKMERIVKG